MAQATSLALAALLAITTIPATLLGGAAPLTAPLEGETTPRDALIDDGEDLSDVSVAFYTEDVHKEIVEAGEVGMAYDVLLRKRVPVDKDQVHIRPGNMLVGRTIDGDKASGMAWTHCTMGFVLEKAGQYAVTTAGHCVSAHKKMKDGLTVTAPLRLNATEFMAVGKVIAFDGHQTPGPEDPYDWGIVGVDSDWNQNVHPTVLGSAGPTGTYNPVVSTDPGPGVGDLQPLPAYHVGQEYVEAVDAPPKALGSVDNATWAFSGTTGQDGTSLNETWRENDDALHNLPTPLVFELRVPAWGTLVEKVGGLYLCECAALNGDSGSPVVVPTDAHPRGAAVGLITEGIGRGEQPEGPRPDNLLPWIVNLEQSLEENTGKHELTEIVPLSTVLANATGWSLATAVDLEDTVPGELGCGARNDPLCPVPGDPGPLDCSHSTPFEPLVDEECNPTFLPEESDAASTLDPLWTLVPGHSGPRAPPSVPEEGP